jgi:hypothetical protein
MQVIYSKTVKTFAFLNLFVLFLAPFDVAQGKLKKNQKKLPAADLTPTLSKGEGDNKEFFVH